MSKAKNHNSILFLTTLGLYLGLVMVGGSPQVLARAATTRNFDIRDEIEFKDDLDKKPEDTGATVNESSQPDEFEISASSAVLLQVLHHAAFVARPDHDFHAIVVAEPSVATAFPRTERETFLYSPAGGTYTRPPASILKTRTFTVAHLPRGSIDSLLRS